MKVKHFSFFKPTFQVVVNLYWTHASGCAGVEYVACFQGKELRYVGDDLVYLIQHIAGATLLNGLSVHIQMEVQGLQIHELLLGHPFADGCRTVEPLADGPWLSGLAGLALQVACCKVDTYGHGIVVAMGKTLGDVIA